MVWIISGSWGGGPATESPFTGSCWPEKMDVFSVFYDELVTVVWVAEIYSCYILKIFYKIVRAHSNITHIYYDDSIHKNKNIINFCYLLPFKISLIPIFYYLFLILSCIICV